MFSGDKINLIEGRAGLHIALRAPRRAAYFVEGQLVRIALAQASTFEWERYVGHSGRIISTETFGASALKELQNRFGFEPDRVILVAKELLGRDDL